MTHLYIIGNGFDIFTGLKTRYVDFRYWLKNNNPFIFENMEAAYDMDVEWWNDYEVQLGKLDIKAYISKFTPPEKTLDESQKRREIEKKYNLSPSLQVDTTCANRLRGLLDILQYCFEKWVEDYQRMIPATKFIKIEKENSFFINFNYTDVLQSLYKIPEERVLHIHGRASKRERLIFGHNTHLFEGGDSNENKTCFELSRYEKNPYEHINKHGELLDKLKDVEFVHIYGISFSPVDEDYTDWIYKNAPSNSKWEISWYSEMDLKRINTFLMNYHGLKERTMLIRLDDISEKLCNDTFEMNIYL